MIKAKTKPELLAPVGSMESLIAAVQNGCDAVYLGGKSFSARAFAPNFTESEIKQALNYAHFFGVRVYITVNTLYKDDELEKLLEYVMRLYHSGVDAIILQDIGVSRLIKKQFPDLEIHASTQMTIHNSEGAQKLKKWGFNRVVLARELTLDEIKEIVAKSSIEVETFIHGALCVCYSGQCLMSSMIGGRSGNRGRCAQPCRLPYRLIDLNDRTIITPEPKYLLSPKDICTIEILPLLINSGISSFKIEGRMKRPEYTAIVTRIYRKYLNYAYENSDDYLVNPQDIRDLAQIFNRGGFSEGYYKKQQGSLPMSYQRPKNWGIKIGEVISYDQKKNLCSIKLYDNLEIGDGIEIWTNQTYHPGTIVHSAKKHKDMITLPIKGRINKGDKVYRTSQKSLLDELKKTYQNCEKKIAINGKIFLHPGEPMTLELWDDRDNFVKFISDDLIERAKNQPLTKNKIREQISKTGDFLFRLDQLEIDMTEDVFLPISKLNTYRRAALTELKRKRISAFRRSHSKKDLSLKKLIKQIDCVSQITNSSKKPELVAYLKGKQFDPVKFIQHGVKTVYINLEFLTTDKIDKLKNLGSRVFAVLPRIARNKEMGWIKEKIAELEQTSLEGFLVSNLGELELVLNIEKQIKIDYPINTFNRLTLAEWENLRITGVTLSPELNLHELAQLAQWVNIQKEIIIYGNLPLMVSEYCPINFLKKDNNFSCHKNKYGLLDRKNIVFPIIPDCRLCRVEILNSQPLFMLDQLDKLLSKKFDILRMDLTIEREEDALELVDMVLKQLKDPNQLVQSNIKGKILSMFTNGFTRGHFFRGVE